MVKFIDQLPALYLYLWNQVKRKRCESLPRRNRETLPGSELRRFQRLVSVDVSKHFFCTVCTAFYGHCIEHPKQLATYRNHRLHFLQWVFCSCRKILMEFLKFLIFRHQWHRRSEQDCTQMCSPSPANFRLAFMLSGTVFRDGESCQLLQLARG